MRSVMELHGLGEDAARTLAKKRRDEALEKLLEARAEFEDWDAAVNRLHNEWYQKHFARGEA